MSDEDDSDWLAEDFEFEPARYASELDLPFGDPQKLADASAAVRQEYRDSSRWKRLQCTKVSLFAERDRGTVFVIHIGKAVEFDWTWEGATAFCPSSLDDDRSYSDRFYEEADFEDDLIWSGEIVEVDERNGCLFVALNDLEKVPAIGPFFVRPFEFLSVLDELYSGESFETLQSQLPSRLAAAEGDIHPKIASAQTGLPALTEWWRHSWGVLWGPPGTGKTWTTGQQIARVVGETLSETNAERVLIVSTTNRATDAVALSLGDAAKNACPELLESETLLRIGKGASLTSFVNRQLDSMLAGTESQVLSRISALTQQLPLFDNWEEKAFTRKQIAELRTTGNDQSQRIFVNPDKRVIVATAFRTMRFLKDETVKGLIDEGDCPFTTIVIDEAGLISRAAIAALSLLAARRVILVGDSKQLAPISRISRVLPTRQQTWLASSGLSHLEETSDVPKAVYLLTEQRRMHPEICAVVSAYQYNGVLKTATERVNASSALTPFLKDHSRAIWYVLDAEDCPLEAIRASRGPGNQSWVRAITESVLKKLFADNDVRDANGLFISPFKAQANMVGDLLAGWGLTTWEASTVHSQQGSEADIVIFDTVNAGNHTWGIVEWKRLVNVAISRAREAVIVLASRSEMEEPYLRSLRSHLKPSVLVKKADRFVWSDVSSAIHRLGSEASTMRVVDPSANYQVAPPETGNPKAPGCRMGDQIAARKPMKPQLSQEQQRLTNLELDGKPRLVRGVAGSGKSVVLCNWLAKTVKRLRDRKDARIWAVYANRSLHQLLCESIESAWDSLNEGELFDRTTFPWEHVELLHVKDVLSGMLPSVQLKMDDFGFDYDRAAEEFLNRQDTDHLLPRCTALFIDEAQDMGPATLRLLLSVVEQSDESDANSRSAHLFYDNAQNVYNTKTPKWTDFGLDMRGRSTIMRESFRSTRPITEFAANVLSRLSGEGGRQDQQELVSMGLLKPTERNGQVWLEAKYSQVEGPKPMYRQCEHRNEEMRVVGRHLRHLIEVDGISPTDICVIYNGGASETLKSMLEPKLKEFGVELSFQRNRSFERKANTLIATTAHSYKGYESEVVVIPCVDHFIAAQGKILANGLYVAMTRARSLLAIYGVDGGSAASHELCTTLAACTKAQATEAIG
ncbi:AAA domain-containing protein [Rhodopirellula sp. MGV]|uniref:AAA domain-containing protein n=1 Tax=Rhodopirellula sp. MGV TaxID=2023130 RepID=UPI000B960338|nr:AAA domain-containing protein [Rhodopirellula sp. MGV]OYP33883.1 AAA family ATPase [Rhodopirellula sp. MGV]PNY37304.1 AAA family ATPase [Rhodopirellula baltica]